MSNLVVTKPSRTVDWSNRKAIVIESDDWGACLALPNMNEYEDLRELFPACYNQSILNELTTTLESPSDMEKLFSVLEGFTGGDGRYAVFQANYVMSNPDPRYGISGLESCRLVPLPDLPTVWRRGDIIRKAREGISRGLWHPEFHGKTHVNHRAYLRDLRESDLAALISAKGRSWYVWMILYSSGNKSDGQYYDHFSEWSSGLPPEQQKEDIESGIAIFESVFGRKPRSAIAPSYIWQFRTERFLNNCEVRIIQGKNRQYRVNHLKKISDLVDKKIVNRLWLTEMGDYNPILGLRYLSRNVDFEPSSDPMSVTKAYEQILEAWKRDQPAIISTHRSNYVGLDVKTIDNNLKQLRHLLQRIQSDHPQAVYLTDWEVAQLYESGTSLRRSDDNEIIYRDYRILGGDNSRVKIPGGYRVVSISKIPDGQSIRSYSPVSSSYIELSIEPGNYCISLKRD